MPVSFPTPRRLVLVASLCLSGFAAAQTLDHEKATHVMLSSATVTLTGRSELHLTGGGDPIPGCTIHLNSEDSWVFFHNVVPSAVVSNLLSRFRVNGATAVADTNVRVAQYVNGTVVIARPPGFRGLEVFTGPHMTGAPAKLASHTAYNNAALGGFADNIRSFVLKRGYTATFAANENGTGVSRNFVAQDGDLEVSLMPAGLDGTVSFVRVYPWRWVGKKGSCDVDPVALNAKWHYNWNNSQNSARNWEYVPIKQQPHWPGLGNVGNYQTQQVTHVLGFNEPNNPVEDSYKNLTPQGSVSNAVARWDELLGTGLRVGAPAVTDGGYSWIVDFINQANAAGKRVDYVPVHYYRSSSGNNPTTATTAMYNFLKSIYDVAQRPIWVTEFNNGANWTDNAHDPNVTQNRDVIQAMIQMMDTTPWIERYAIYSNVEWFRKTHYDDGSLTPMGAMYRDRAAPMAYQQTLPNTGSSGNAAYLFDNNLRDTQSGNNPLVHGTPKYVAGKHGNALSFDGTDDHLALPSRLGDSNDFSFATWVNWNGGGNWQRIFDLGNGQPSYLFLTPKSGSNTLRFAMRLNNGAEQQLNTAALTPGTWTHVAVTISGDTGKLFVNGSLVNTNTGMTLNPSQIGTETNYLGKSQFAADPLFSGLLDDTRFFNHALSDAQVTALAGAVAPQFVASPAIGGAVADQAFTGNLASQLAAGSVSATFSKTGGPSWISLAADGSFSGVPRTADIGSGALLVRATSGGGAITDIAIPVTVGAASPLARYAFDGSPLAAAGTADATLAGGPLYAAGQRGQAIDLDGTDDHVVLPAGIASGDEITLATWVQWDGGGNWQRIFDFGNGTGSYLFLTPKSGSNTLRFVILDNGAEGVLETTALTAGAWTHVAVTLGGGTGRLYVNGNLADTEAITLKPSGIRPTLNYLGRSMYAADPYFNGRLDEFHVFHRVLSSTEINGLRTGTAPALAFNPLVLPPATPGTPCEASVTGAATASGTITWSKVGGPAWLTVDPDGRVSGVPGSSDSGTVPFRLRATTGGVLSTDFNLTLNVQPPADLRVHLELDGNATSTVSASHATATGSPAYTAGLFDQAVDLDGGDDFLQLPAGIVSDLTDCTFATRFRWDGGNAWQRIFDFGNNTTQYFILTPGSGSGTLRFAITTGGNATQQFIETAPPNVGEWTHVAVVLSGDTGTLYVNGVAAATGPITLDPAQIAPALNYLGKSQWPDPLFNGAIDDFRIFTRALDASEVRALAIPPAAIVIPSGYRWWAMNQPFGEGQGEPEADDDGDGLANALEWLSGTDPLLPASAALPVAERLAAAELGLEGDKTHLAFSARIRKQRPGVTLIPEAVATLADFGTPEAAANARQAGPPVDDGAFEIFTWYHEVPVEDSATGFMRLRVVQE